MTLKEIELQLANLQRAVLQLASNGVAQTQTVDATKSETANNTADIETLETTSSEHTEDISLIETAVMDMYEQMAQNETDTDNAIMELYELINTEV